MSGRSPPNDERPAGLFWKSRAGAVLIAFLVVGALLLAYEHRIHLLTGDALLVLLLLACIGMHLFMHHGHGGGGGSGPGGEK